VGRTIDPAINDVAGFRPAAAFALLLAFALAGAAPVRATDTEAAEPELSQPVMHAHRKPLARDPAAAIAKRLDLDANQQESRVAAAADARQITVSPISRFTIAPVRSSGLVLGFGGIKPAAIEAGVEVLAEVLASCADGHGASGRRTARLSQVDR